MRRKISITAIVAVITLTAAASAWAWGGKSGDRNAKGRITELKVHASQATVQGITSKGSLWLAYTVRYHDGVEVDHEPVKVKGKFTKTVYYQPRPQGLKAVLVCLWRYKVTAKRCAKDNGGKACQYCRKNGFHMEERMDGEMGRP